ncbi:MAG: large conductance mechanosensitive channel [Actinomycetota bacterium]|nr:large conductance mechanosensitive channel [Actinomycetota bacterium]
MVKGFKEFILRGNVIDLAVAVVIGAAFAALVTAFTDALITPLINLILGGGVDAGQFEVNGQVFDISLLINAIITFIITAAVVYFIFVVPMNKFKERTAKNADDADEEEVDEQVLLLREIRDALNSGANPAAAAPLSRDVAGDPAGSPRQSDSSGPAPTA